MSVIPFVLDGDAKTVVESQDEYHKADGINGNVIFIENLDREQIADTKSGNACYDLRVGNEYKDHRDLGKTSLSNGDRISLQPGSAVIIETTEEVHFPKSRFGHIVPRVSLLQKGLSNTSSKIDPGYKGKLLITVFNLGKRQVFLEKNERFCTLYVLEITGQTIPYDKPYRGLPGARKHGFLRNLGDFIEVNQTYFTIVLTIATIALTVATLALTIVQLGQSSLPQEVKTTTER
jgi:dCTP deaminase